MRTRRTKVSGSHAVYHCMTRTVNGERLFGDREKEILRKMLWQVAEFSGVEILTYCIMSNHFHVLVRVFDGQQVSDVELMRRYKILYPKPTKYQEASAVQMAKTLEAGGEEAACIRQKLRARMGDVSEFMKAVKQRFSVWYNRSHQRYGTLWAERFKSVLVEGKGNPLQTMAAYIDLNPVRAGIVADPKDYRFCGYAEAVAGDPKALAGLVQVWKDYLGQGQSGEAAVSRALKSHRLLIFGKRAAEPCLPEMTRRQALQVLEQEDGCLSKHAILRCRVRYFTDGAIFGSQEFVHGFVGAWQMEKGRKHPPKVNALRGADWGDLSVINSLKRQVFS
ncbi:transposase [Coraliomargarita sp. SDUM461003]|uniref:Transposase n=1 Tax=Thalassobacterium maritimum TaxID=3041265 RepID=A0ABU1AUQ2_9BACT|nr:transposase [Coraliomargarita sp. SDUM461003]MDQ8207896.1 transposase [Coraliomargarita sp. SDUM461003]